MPMFNGVNHDFSLINVENLKRKLEFHENDRGCETMEEEIRRMWFVQELTAELNFRTKDI